MSLEHPYIEWTDEIGAARLTCFAYALQNWTPDQWESGDSQTAVGSGRTYFFSYRTDHVAYFEFPNIANTETKLAMRLKSWLSRGGECTISTKDSEDHVYVVCLAPMDSSAQTGALPALTFTDSTELEYTLAMTVKNVDTTPRPMPYTPVAHPRVAGITLSPSPLSLPYPGSPATVTATVVDADGNPIEGVTVSATSDDPSAFTTSAPAVTDGSGHATFTITPHAGGTGGLHVSCGGSTVDDTVTVTTGVYGISSPAPILWLKPDSISGSAVDGTDVTLWPDDAPHHWDMTAMVSSGGGTNPKWDAAKGALRFTSGSSNAYENVAFDDFASSSEFTLFIVSQEASNGGCVMSGSGGDFWEGYTSAGRYRMDLGSFGYGSYFTFADLLGHVHETRYDGGLSGAARLIQLLDGTTPALTQYYPPASLASANGMCIGHGTGLTFFNGWLWEVLLFPARLSDADCASVQAQLTAKYGL